MRRAFSLAALIFVALAGRAVGQSEQDSDRMKTMVGSWQISNADGDKTCTVVLTPDAAPGGHKLAFDKTCGDVFPVTKDVTAWTAAAEGLLLLDAGGKSLLDLDEVENGVFEGVRPEEGRYVMRNLAAAHVEAKPEQIVGDWDVSQGTDTPLCVITFSNTTAADGFALQLKPGCDPLVSDFNPTSWRLERGDLVLSAAQGVWRFEPAGSTAWQRIPEDPSPLWLVRP